MAKTTKKSSVKKGKVEPLYKKAQSDKLYRATAKVSIFVRTNPEKNYGDQGRSRKSK